MKDKLDKAWGDFLAGIEPNIREENDRRFLCMEDARKQNILWTATKLAGGSRESVAAILYCELGISHQLAEKLVL